MLLFLPVCSRAEVERSHWEEVKSTWFLKSPKAPAQESVPPPAPCPLSSYDIISQLVDAKAKK